TPAGRRRGRAGPSLPGPPRAGPRRPAVPLRARFRPRWPAALRTRVSPGTTRGVRRTRPAPPGAAGGLTPAPPGGPGARPREPAGERGDREVLPPLPGPRERVRSGATPP